MGLFNFNKKRENAAFIDFLNQALTLKVSIKNKAIEEAIDLIAKTISKCEIQVYRKKDKKIISVRDEIYYKLNIKPNDNEFGTSFFYRVVSQLMHDQEVLIVEIGGNLYIANSFSKSNSVIKGKVFTNVILNDASGETFAVKKSFNTSNSIYLTLCNSKINNAINDYWSDFGKLIEVSSLQYKRGNVPKWKLLTPGNQPAIVDKKTNKEVSYDEYKEKITDGLFDEEEKIILLSESLKLEKINGDKAISSSDYIALEEKWRKEVATAFSIPLDVFNGNKTDKSTGTNDFISFAVVPILRILEDGLNGIIIGKDKYIDGERIFINKLNMKHFDIFDSANSLDKLFGDGFSHNDLRYFLDIPNIDEEWANEHNITKNYGSVASMHGKGGD